MFIEPVPLFSALQRSAIPNTVALLRSAILSVAVTTNNSPHTERRFQMQNLEHVLHLLTSNNETTTTIHEPRTKIHEPRTTNHPI
jgi:hypothetical protein